MTLSPEIPTNTNSDIPFDYEHDILDYYDDPTDYDDFESDFFYDEPEWTDEMEEDFLAWEQDRRR